MSVHAYAIIFSTVLMAAQAGHAAHQLDGRDLGRGEALYAEHCAACHGKSLEGQPDWQIADENGIRPAPPHDETGHTWHHDNGTLFDYTSLGGDGFAQSRGISGFTSGMTGFGDVLSDDEIWDILGFIRSTWPSRVQATQALRNPPHN